jgi:polyisoprenoid-binding protein YceI
MAWTIDTTHTHLGFSVKHMMVTTVRGQFRTYGGSVRLDPKDFTRSSIEGWADVSSIDTGVADRDNHLRTGDFFDAAAHPKITFKSTRIEHKADNEYVVQGDISIRGVTKPISFAVDFSGTTKNPWGKTIAGVSAEATLNRKDFGVNFNAPLETGGVLVGEKVKIEIECELLQTEDAAATASAPA